ncbi:MAG TPA: BatD family protein [Flavitalea sp.]|nr:BatD family protein [Flavitalea sp.]
MQDVLSIRKFNGKTTPVVKAAPVSFAAYAKLTGSFVTAGSLYCLVFLLLFAHPSLAQRHYFEYDDRVENKSEIKAGETMAGKVKQDFFLKTEVTKTECFVGETIMAAFKAYSRLNADSRVVKRPSLAGFSVMEMVDGYSSNPDVELVNGKYYYVHLIRKALLSPLQPGSFSLEGAEVESNIHFTRVIDEGSPLGSLRNILRGSRRHEEYENLDYYVTLETPVVSVRVNPLPAAGQPADFSGAVGDFTVSVEMPQKEIALHDPAVIRFVISGSGNFPLITAPTISWPKGLKVSAPAVREEVNRYNYPLSGVKTFEYTLETPADGQFSISPLSFSYFDPAETRYKTIHTEALSYRVVPRNGEGPGGDDEGGFALTYKQGSSLRWYWLGGIAVLVLGWIVYQVSRWRRAPKAGRPDAVPPGTGGVTPEYKAADDSMGRVSAAYAEGNKQLFYGEALQTVRNVIGERYRVPSNILSKDQLLGTLARDRQPETLRRQVLTLMDKCEWALYTPEYNQDDMDETYTMLQSVLQQLKA